MNPETIFNLQTLLSLILFFIIAKWYVLPSLYKKDYYSALIPLLLFSAFRYLGLNFLVPHLSNGVADTVFAVPAAYGDFSVGILALVATLLLRFRSSIGVALAWLYAVVGAADFIMAGFLGTMSDLPTKAGSLWSVLTVAGPAWMITILFLFVVLIRHPGKSPQASRKK